MIWEYLREEEFEEAIKISKGVCAMPVGCIERGRSDAQMERRME